MWDQEDWRASIRAESQLEELRINDLFFMSEAVIIPYLKNGIDINDSSYFAWSAGFTCINFKFTSCR